MSKNGSFSIGRSYHKGFMKTFLQQKREGPDYSVEVSQLAPEKLPGPKKDEDSSDQLAIFSWENSLLNFGSVFDGPNVWVRNFWSSLTPVDWGLHPPGVKKPKIQGWSETQSGKTTSGTRPLTFISSHGMSIR